MTSDMGKFFACMVGGVFGSAVFAQTPSHQDRLPDFIQKEATANPPDPVWMPVLDKMIFRDSADVIWFQFPVARKQTWVDAKKLCDQHHLTLPTRGQVEHSKLRLLREEQKATTRAPTFWIAPDEGVAPNFRHHFVSHFNGELYGYFKIDDVMTSFTKAADVVRCVFQSTPFVAPMLESTVAADVATPLK